ncbi:uncharacterized protein LOC124366252 [Homalodisca vitripennis]|uniref:uncharacterized protein LOC124366252 n=1 Tax=Homalodisca vitripennis TaxID=197043 RepID=UPI001EEBF12B|nr:uncharacterized protein LOC124366252 [Homalodisca vitripennis]KAG8283753.1 hypothetical protein J6590_011123 [Homalodisca vitripennis]KAG8283755.1 hypothetical protein J6590_011125 [Homalodisca vitripennis]
MTRKVLLFGARSLAIVSVVIIVQLGLLSVFLEKTYECVSSNRTLAPLRSGTEERPGRNIPDWEKTLDFTGFNNETGTADGHYIIPNYVHFLKFQYATFNFIHMICVLAAFKHQRPEKLFIHTDVPEFYGKYWEVLINTPGFKEVLVIKKMDLPKEVFGQPLNPAWAGFHGGDVARLIVMRKYGGIYVDNDSYLIRNMDDLRRYEMVVAYRPGKPMMNQVVLAHKDARLLKEWQDGYKDYRPGDWYYNAGQQPGRVLRERPYLVHSLPDLLGTYDIRRLIYLRRWRDWKTYYSCHLMVRWVRKYRHIGYPNPIEEKDVLKYDNTFVDMIQDVYDIKRLKRKKGLAYREN